MNPLLSIIIPVYNVSRYLPDTLDTLSSQEGLDECEIICIDDGSTDTSLQILQSYKDRIPNLKIVSKQNEGVSATRNTGISMSEGKFISFIDADDLLHPHALRLILNEIRKGDADIICWRYRPFYSKPEYSDLADTGIIEISNKNLEAFDIMADKGIAVGIYLKGIKRELFFTPDVRFDTSMTYGEDMFVSWKCVLKAEKIILIDRPLYYYRQTSWYLFRCQCQSRCHCRHRCRSPCPSRYCRHYCWQCRRRWFRCSYRSRRSGWSRRH